MKHPASKAPSADPESAAHAAGLRYVTDLAPGLHRHRAGKGFRYTDSHGHAVRDAATLARIKSLVIPPAWQDVWICASPIGHLQCTGRDARGRKQSRYHPEWRTVRDETKYDHIRVFAQFLPAIRRRVTRDLKLPGMPRNKVLATIVRLMETTFIRVGNEEYARENQSFGLTTFRNRHAQVHGSEITFTFRGKSGVQHCVSLADKRLARIIHRCQDIPGYELFQYLDSEGNHHSIESTDVNDYLRDISAQHITAKDFRTWAGSVLACELLQLCEPCTSKAQSKKDLVTAIKSVAERLGNTPSVCRKCYIHPLVLQHFLDGSIHPTRTRKRHRALHAHEAALLDLLDHKLPPQ